MKNVTEQIVAIVNFIKRYSVLCAVAVIALILSAIVPAWNFVPYGIAKAALAIVTGLFLRNVFLTTFDRYIDAGRFREDFLLASPSVRVCVTAAAALGLFLGACICFAS